MHRSFILTCSGNSPSLHPESSPSAKPATHRPQLITLTRRQLMGGAGLALACPWCASASQASALEYSYSTDDPKVWSGVCHTGKTQSPVNLPVPYDLESAPQSPYGLFKAKYPRFTRASCKNAGHGTPQVEIPEEAGAMCYLGDTPLRLLQFHFHAPSEHLLNGVHGPMEVHLVHKNGATGELVVVAALCHITDRANPSLAAALECVPSEVGAVNPMKSALNLLSLLPRPRSTGGDRPYVTYKGSTTTPPCSEGVTWVVLLDPVGVTAAQVVEFEFFAGGGKNMGYNAREEQPLGTRNLEYSL